MAGGIGNLIRKYSIVVLSPSVTASIIYLDYQRTQKFIAERENYQKVKKIISKND